MKLEIDAEFASLIPPLSAEEYMQLEENLLAEGCRDALVVWNGVLIDGHNRYGICQKHGLEFKVYSHEFSGREDALRFIILNQFGRRNLSVGNRCLLALKLEPLIAEKAARNWEGTKLMGRGIQKKDMAPQKFAEPLETRKEVAKIAGVSHTTVDKVKRILEQGTPEQVARIRKGDKGNSVHAVYREVSHKQSSSQPKSDLQKEDSVLRGEVTEPVQKKTAAQPEIPTRKEEDIPENTAPSPARIGDELNQIRKYVADLKNPDLDRSFTSDMFLVEYEAFAERFIRSLGAYAGAPYKDAYPLLSKSERIKMMALNASMIRAIEQRNIEIRG